MEEVYTKENIMLIIMFVFAIFFVLFLFIISLRARKYLIANENELKNLESNYSRIKIIEISEEWQNPITIVSVDGMEYIVNRKGGIIPLINSNETKQ